MLSRYKNKKESLYQLDSQSLYFQIIPMPNSNLSPLQSAAYADLETEGSLFCQQMLKLNMNIPLVPARD